jgi:hypothetical protein
MPRRTLKYLASKPDYVTLTELARSLNLPFKTACRLMRTGALEPDAILGQSGLFLKTRVPDLALALELGEFGKISCGPARALSGSVDSYPARRVHNRVAGLPMQPTPSGPQEYSGNHL